MNEENIKAVYLDLDGTVLDTIRDVYNTVSAVIAAHGYEVQSYEHFLSLAMMPIDDIFAGMLPRGKDSPGFEDINRCYDAQYSENCAVDTCHFAGMPELLEDLSENGFALGIITNKGQEVAQKVMDLYFPQIPFQFVLGSRPDLLPKPDPAPGLYGAGITGIDPRDTIYVGDSPTDLRFAIHAGFHPVAALWGYMSEESLRSVGAEYFASTAGELHRYLKARLHI